jgi:hypothetical protein
LEPTSPSNDGLGRVIHDVIRRAQEPLGLDRWSIKIQLGQIEDKGSCMASPEYKEALLQFNLDKFETGDEPDEIAVHEMSHNHTWAIHTEAEDLANLVADMMPEPLRDGVRKKLLEEVRRAGEDSTTQVGFTYIRLLRRLWKAEEELKALRAEVRQLKKVA